MTQAKQPAPAPQPLPAVQELTALSGQLDALRRVSAKLMKAAAPAADDMVSALEEVAKTFGAFEAELVRYLTLRFKGRRLDKDLEALVALEGGVSGSAGCEHAAA